MIRVAQVRNCWSLIASSIDGASVARAIELSGSSLFTLGTANPGRAGPDILSYTEAGLGLLLVTGSAIAPVTGECARCLDPLPSTIEVSFQELYRYLPDPGEDENDVEERFLDGDFLDLEPAFRDAVVLTLPLSPLCRDDCPGLCVECGAKLADVGPEHNHGEKVDPRWGLLAKLDIHDTTE